jgi:hypothetical protein
MPLPEKPISSTVQPPARPSRTGAGPLARCGALFTSLPVARQDQEQLEMPENVSVWIVVIGVLTALWIFIFKFIAPFVDRMTMREVRLSKIERDIENLTAKIDLIYEVMLERNREQE